jgi:DNA mismatch endonuclease (patch repair protein)
MSRIRSRNTTPERAVRDALWHKGYRYRLNDRRLPGSPDLVLPKYRAVIFINGCFWHGHRGCTKYTVPKTNEQFWREKVARNIARDELNAQRLDTLAWTVITVWECELSKKNLDATITRLEADLQAAKTKYEHYLSIRRENREFARQQAKKHREILAQVNAELNLPQSLLRYARQVERNEP